MAPLVPSETSISLPRSLSCSSCRAPYRCCHPGSRPEADLNNHGSPLSRTGVRGELSNGPSTRQTNLDTSDTESESEGGAPPSTLMLLPTAGQKRQRESEQAARQAESDAKAALAPARQAQAEEEEKEARAQVAEAEAAKLREEADRL